MHKYRGTRDLCPSCRREVLRLPNGRLAFHYFVATGIGVQCTGEPEPAICPACRKEISAVDGQGRIPNHNNGKNGFALPMTCAGSGQPPWKPS